jgi:ZIP family zinc transporter
MIEFFEQYDPIFQSLFATLFTWGVTAFGAAGVYLSKEISRKLLDGMLGFAAGVMIAASYWSLLAPSIEISESLGVPAYIPPAVGFLAGGIVLWLIDRLLPHLHLGLPMSQAEGIKTTWQRSVLLILAITMHNVPEGMAIGVAFGAAAAGIPGASVAGAVALALGIGIQNFPEGLAISAPLRREGFNRFRSWWYGQLSAIVEPMGALIGAAAVITMRQLLPYALAFAAGAMIYVVIEELIPEAENGQNTDIATAGAMLGFVVMMILDVALG